MSSLGNGGPAFPQAGYSNPRGKEEGISLRNYYAGQIVAGVVVQGATLDVDKTAKYCFDLADAMVKASES